MLQVFHNKPMQGHVAERTLHRIQKVAMNMTTYIAKFKNGRTEELRSEHELDEFLRHFDIETEIAYVSVKSDPK